MYHSHPSSGHHLKVTRDCYGPLQSAEALSDAVLPLKVKPFSPLLKTVKSYWPGFSGSANESPCFAFLSIQE